MAPRAVPSAPCHDETAPPHQRQATLQCVAIMQQTRCAFQVCVPWLADPASEVHVAVHKRWKRPFGLTGPSPLQEGQADVLRRAASRSGAGLARLASVDSWPRHVPKPFRSLARQWSRKSVGHGFATAPEPCGGLAAPHGSEKSTTETSFAESGTTPQVEGLQR